MITVKECPQNLIETVSVGINTGFVIHQTKSVFNSTLLGYIINSIEMIVTLTEAKKERIIGSCSNLPPKDLITIRDLSTVIS